MKNTDNSSGSSLPLEFEEIVKQIFISNGFKIEPPVQKIIRKGGIPIRYLYYDFLVTIDNIYAYVEVKFYRTKLPNLNLLEHACHNLLSAENNGSVKLILVVSSYITPSLKDKIFKESNVIVWDAKTLVALAFDYSELYYNLENILIKTYDGQLDNLLTIDKNLKKTIIPQLKLPSIGKQKKSEPINYGENLYNELCSLNSGRRDAKKFEKKCTEILKYLYDNKTDLTLWKLQQKTDDELHEYDLLCRIISYNQNSFWR